MLEWYVLVWMKSSASDGTIKKGGKTSLHIGGNNMGRMIGIGLLQLRWT